ncbi:ABC-type sulfate transport system permease component-like protein [Limnospira maxima CS-328]|uniref:ABC-type sulfate transport system permease component-like protein n=1 Tax=Limnospira maxima CS-328 TaxID=513049 RepID=B5W875_LIMMA|nr:ABC-type sulfate transport system permease component-like protein [Limnospira maxima CS-328]
MLLLPILALISFTANLTWAEIWRITTHPVALSAYRVTFFTAIYATSINGIAGVAVAWVLVRYRFPGKEIIDGAIDLPFALPTAVAGLTLATVYAENGWIGSLLAPLGIKIAFTRLGVGLAMVFISLPFVVRTVQPVLQELEPELEEVAWCMGCFPLANLSPSYITSLNSRYFNRGRFGIFSRCRRVWFHCYYCW